jgi:peptidase C13-like protein
VWSAFKLALRGVLWKRAPDSPRVGLSALIGWTLVLAIVGIAIRYVEAAPAPVSTDPPAKAAKVESAQASLVKAAAARLAPQQPGTTDIYALGVAGWAGLDVFTKEIDGAFVALAQILPIRDRMLRLINNRNGAKTVPLATRGNFAAAVQSIGRRMDEDVLLLVMSSHGTSGTSGGFALQLPGGSMQTLTPNELKSVLDGEGIKHRIVIVSACYSGKFVWPLANDNTIVLTAADAMSSSFGCAAGRDWTYFGDALFRQSIQPATNLWRSFDHARVLIRGWETMDRLPPSNPQAHFGPALVAKLDPVIQAASRAGQ